jgi:aryl-alcohol dehydrogenase-like predicted oxidoreductase
MAETWASWRERVLPALDSLLEAFREKSARQSQVRSDTVTAAPNPHLPLTRYGEGPSRKALWVLASTPGVTTVLLGVRHPAYIEDGMEALKLPPLPDVRKVYEALREVRIP